MTDGGRPRWRDLDRRYLLEGTLVAALILGPSVAVALALDVEHGSVAEWVSAVATVAAVIAAVYAGIQAADVLRLERNREERIEEDRRRQQAALVAAWTTFELTHGLQRGQQKVIIVRVEVHTRNASPVPVTQMRISMTVVQVKLLPSGQPHPLSPNFRVASFEHVVGLVPPTAETIESVIPVPEHQRARVLSALSDDPSLHVELQSSVEFMDAAGVRWRRDHRGTLVELAPDGTTITA